MGSGYARPQLLRLGPAPFCSRAAAPSAVLEEPVRSVAHGAVGTDNVDHPATTAICSKSLRAKTGSLIQPSKANDSLSELYNCCTAYSTTARR